MPFKYLNRFEIFVFLLLFTLEFVGRNLSSLINPWALNNKTHALAYCIQCVKSCVVTELDEITSYLVDKIKITVFIRYKRDNVSVT